MEAFSADLLWQLLKHASAWLTNLGRASEARKQASIRALREVIKAARESAVYARHLKQGGGHDHHTEARLAVLWTELGFALHDIGIEKLAKRCQINGQLWADPQRYDQDFLHKADASLPRMEALASEILHVVTREEVR